MSTVLGLACVDGVVLAGDRLHATDGHVRGTRRHVFEFDSVGVAAVGDDVDGFVDRLEAECRSYRTDRGAVRIVPFARMASDLAAEFGVSALVAAPDEAGTPRLRAVASDGSVTDDDVAAFGSGASLALGALEASHDPESTLDAAVTLARDALDSAATRDAGTGDEVDLLRLPADSSAVP
ncbi:proteasome beta subunit [Haloplanus vescus]|uniref:Proteasome beta subunit n=1 Tax=Haloplanus vescus TaxID=555874 RepID=A0A1H3ZIW1_9EURY|nr:hypothetical protein [Haloplanus vescus]SEA23341.1 proteasome beta subunit [Haloplanus vescus]